MTRCQSLADEATLHVDHTDKNSVDTFRHFEALQVGLRSAADYLPESEWIASSKGGVHTTCSATAL
ncbi:MAG: hypothetical protein ACJ8AW_28530 [Rhodopila sp.]